VIWVTGCRGMLGRQVCRALTDAGCPCEGTDTEVDIADSGAVNSFCARETPAWIINCAAYTAVDRAEREEEAARRVNADGPAVLAQAARRTGARIIHFSTDYVFDGTSSAPYCEDDPPHPVSVYGKSKLEGEDAVRNLCERYYIFRLSWLYGAFGGGFPGRIVRLLRDRQSIEVVDDQTASPTACRQLSENLVCLVRNDPEAYGLYHYCDRGIVTRYGFACAIAREAEARGLLSPGWRVIPVTTEAYARSATMPVARRPASSCLDTQKVRRVLGFQIAPWEENLSIFFNDWVTGGCNGL